MIDLLWFVLMQMRQCRSETSSGHKTVDGLMSNDIKHLKGTYAATLKKKQETSMEEGGGIIDVSRTIAKLM